MDDAAFPKMTESMCLFIDRIKVKQKEILRWLDSHENTRELPLYSSVDIRDSGLKIAVVDTNLFPAGFNNLCEHGLDDAVKFLREAVDKRVPGCRDILIVAEEHTRNTWYLENIRILQQIIEKAGYQTKIATFISVQPSFCENAKYVELETATNQPVRIYCFKKILADYEADRQNIDLIIMNNDLTTGIPEILKHSKIPIYPSVAAGWHARHKSHHFAHTEELMAEFARIIDLDPWLFSCLYSVADHVDINVESDRKNIRDLAVDLFNNIKKKYQEHGINEKPYIVIKPDAGTYGMGVIAVEDPSEILNLNRRNRNNLYKGKSAQIIDRILLQEGVSTIYTVDQLVSEVVIYQIENNLIGGFYRTNAQKGSRENLNSAGMDFKKMCPHLKKYGDCRTHHDVNVFDVYRILARIAGMAAHREIVQLEAEGK